MSAKAELVDILHCHRLPYGGLAGLTIMLDANAAHAAAELILAAGYRKPRTISTIEEVDALPKKAVVMTAFGDAVTIYRSPRIRIEHYHFLVADGLTATVLHEGPEKVKD